MKFFFDEDNPYPRCCLCGTRYQLDYCSTCKEYFCPRCENRWDLRGIAALVKKKRHLFEGFA